MIKFLLKAPVAVFIDFMFGFIYGATFVALRDLQFLDSRNLAFTLQILVIITLIFVILMRLLWVYIMAKSKE